MGASGKQDRWENMTGAKWNMTGASPVTTILRGGQVAAGSDRTVTIFANS